MTPRRTVPLRRVGVVFALATSLLMSAAVAAILVANARRATQAEVATAFEMAAAYLDEFRTRLQQGVNPMNEALALTRQFDMFRHVKAEIRTPDGRLLSPPSAEEHGAPEWFVWLLSGDPMEVTAYVTAYPNVLGHLVLTSDTRDEAAEVWSDFRDILLAVILVSGVATIATLLTVHVIQRSISSYNAVLRAIGQGDLAPRLPAQRLTELSELGEGIERLASDLGARQAENRRLQQRLMTLSDAERWQVATDLHDGLGPLLFALRSSVASLEGAVGHRPAAAPDLREDVAAIARHAASIQATLREIIYRLRPMIESGRSPRELLSEFRAHMAEVTPEVRVHVEIGPGADRRLDAATGLAFYRFLQESALNAVRHGGARRISVAVSRSIIEPGAPALSIRFEDDGAGPVADAAPGYGQVAMRDRADALGGRYRRPERTGGSTVTGLDLPLAAQPEAGAAVDLGSLGLGGRGPDHRAEPAA